MHVSRRPALAVGLVLMVAVGAGAGPATAQDEDCASSLWAMPIETLDLPEGWSWARLDSWPLGGWSGTIEMSTPEAEQEDEYDTSDSIAINIICLPDPLAYMDSVARARGLFPDLSREIGAIAVGDQSSAYRNTGEYDTTSGLLWANGAVVSSLTAEETVDWSTVEDLALAIDAMLP